MFYKLHVLCHYQNIPGIACGEQNVEEWSSVWSSVLIIPWPRISQCLILDTPKLSIYCQTTCAAISDAQTILSLSTAISNEGGTSNICRETLGTTLVTNSDFKCWRVSACMCFVTSHKLWALRLVLISDQPIQLFDIQASPVFAFVQAREALRLFWVYPTNEALGNTSFWSHLAVKWSRSGRFHLTRCHHFNYRGRLGLKKKKTPPDHRSEIFQPSNIPFFVDTSSGHDIQQMHSVVPSSFCTHRGLTILGKEKGKYQNWDFYYRARIKEIINKRGINTSDCK